MKRYILVVFFAFLTLGLTAQNVLTLDSCFALAKANNVQFKTNKIEVEKAQQVKKQVFTKYFPQVSVDYIAYYGANPIIKYGINEMNDELGEILGAIIQIINEQGGHVPTEIELLKKGHSISATAIQPVYAGGRVRTGNKLAKIGVEAAELQTEVSERDVLENIESTYYLVVGLKAKVETIESTLTLVDSLDKVANASMKAGLVTKNDILRVALERNKYQALLLQLNNAIVLSSQLLCQQIGIEYPESGLVLDEEINSDGKDFAIKSNYERPEIQLLQLQIDAEVMRKRMSRGEALPQIGVGAALTYGNLIKSYKENAFLFARVTVPITQWWETSHKIKEHNLKIEQYELMQQDLTEKMSLEEKQAYNHMIEANALLQSDMAAYDMAQENYRVSELNYRAGENTITDVLEANSLLLQAQNAITDRQITYVTARRRYYDLTGK
ncbi:MAG: TolC family protein [Bacteroidales bacterium]|nr:TolC family protein [Bacteroidales bacterium]